MKNRVLLLAGLPGSGKTTLGQAVAARLRWKFLEASDVAKQLFHFADFSAPVDSKRGAFLDFVDLTFRSRNRNIVALHLSDQCTLESTSYRGIVVAGLRLPSEVLAFCARGFDTSIVYLECSERIRWIRKERLDPVVGISARERDLLEQGWHAPDIRLLADVIIDTERPLSACIEEVARATMMPPRRVHT